MTNNQRIDHPMTTSDAAFVVDLLHSKGDEQARSIATQMTVEDEAVFDYLHPAADRIIREWLDQPKPEQACVAVATVVGVADLAAQLKLVANLVEYGNLTNDESHGLAGVENLLSDLKAKADNSPLPGDPLLRRTDTVFLARQGEGE